MFNFTVAIKKKQRANVTEHGKNMNGGRILNKISQRWQPVFLDENRQLNLKYRIVDEKLQGKASIPFKHGIFTCNGAECSTHD